MELFDIGLDGEEVEASPDFDDLPAEPSKKKICWRKSTAESSLPASLESLQQDVVHHGLTSSSDFLHRHRFLGVKSIKSIPRTLVNTVDTFRRPPLTPHVLSVFTVISDETWKYFSICVCTGYYRVGHSPLLLYYELLILALRMYAQTHTHTHTHAHTLWTRSVSRNQVHTGHRLVHVWFKNFPMEKRYTYK